MSASLSYKTLFEAKQYHVIIQNLSSVDLDELAPDTLNILAASYFLIGEFSLVVPLIKKLEPFLSSDANFLSLCGATYRRLGQLTLACSYFEKAIKIQPSPDIQNNYANLLSDLGQHERALGILSEVLLANPNHPDALVNKDRISKLISSPKSKSSSFDTHSSLPFQLADPLQLAFSYEESVRTVGKLKSSPNINSDNLIKAVKKSSGSDIQGELIQLARRNISEKLYNEALKVLSQALNSGSPTAEIYECASDAYLALQKIPQSEICLLTSYILGSRSSKVLLNFISFTLMRNDHFLSSHIFSQLKQIDPSNPMIPKFKNSLDSHGSTNKKFLFENWELTS